MELYIDLLKSTLNTAKLVKKQVQVKGKNGKVFSRMQWVDPNDNTPVMEHANHEADDHHIRINKLSSAQKQDVADKYLRENTARAMKFSRHTDKPAGKSLFDHVVDNLHKVPMDHIKHHLPPEEHQTNHPHPSIQSDSLNSDEMNIRTGKKGPLDIASLTEGEDPTGISRYWSDGFSDKSSIAETKDLYKSLFGNTTVEGLESVFSGDGFKGDLYSIESYMDKKNHHCEIGLELMNDEGRNVGRVQRAVYRDADGVLNVKNIAMELHSDFQGQGIAEQLYAKSEQYWRHLSGGNPLNIHLTANISVGVYAWAKKGFDFADEKELQYAKRDFKFFCEDNGLDHKEVLSNCGIEHIDDLKHSWDFANLNDGKSYSLKGLVTEIREDYKHEVSGSGSIGKAFMLGGKISWEGVKKLNQDHITEKVHSYNSRKGDKNA